MSFFKKGKVVLLCLILVTSTVQIPKAQAAKLSDQITTDLIGAGVSVAAALSGSVPLALLSGYLVKYISTYGVAGIRSLIDMMKGYTPEELGEVNILYVYLLSTKRNLYEGLSVIKKATERDLTKNKNLREELARIESLLSQQCNIDAGCTPTGLNESMINYQYVNIVLDGKMTLDVNEYLTQDEIKNTYQYLILLYLDTIIVEQKLMHAQNEILANRVEDTMSLLRKNEYLSQPEKELQAQIVLDLALRWKLMAAKRKVVVAQIIQEPLKILKAENEDLEKLIEEYKAKYGKKKRGS